MARRAITTGIEGMRNDIAQNFLKIDFDSYERLLGNFQPAIVSPFSVIMPHRPSATMLATISTAMVPLGQR